MGGINFGWVAVWVLSPDWLCRKLEVHDFVRRLGEAAAHRGRECGPCPDFVSYTLAFALQLRKTHEKTSLRVTEGRSAYQRRTRFVYSTWPSRALASTGLLVPAALGFRVRRRGPPSVSVSIYRVAVVGGSSHQLTLCQSPQSGL